MISNMVVVKVSFNNCWYFLFLFFCSNAVKILSTEKNIAIKIESTIFRLFKISLSIHLIKTMAIAKRAGIIKILMNCSGLFLNMSICWYKIERISKKLLFFREKLHANTKPPAMNRNIEILFTDTTSRLSYMQCHLF